MRYAFTLGGKVRHVTLEEHAEGPKFIVDGEAFEASVVRTGPGAYTVSIGDEDHTFQIGPGGILHGSQQLDLEVRRAKPVLQRAGGKSRKANGQIKPPMPGKVVEIHVAVGDMVAEGDPLLVLEAMKMQNDLKSPVAGKVTDVKVQAGQNVEATTVMVVITPE